MKNLFTIIAAVFCTLLTSAQTTSIPDSNFEQALIDLGLDSGTPDGAINTSSIDTVTVLDVSGYTISSLTGIEGFEVLTYLNCSNNNLTTLPLSSNSFLSHLDCSMTMVANPVSNISNYSLIESLSCGTIYLTLNNFSILPNLKFLDISNSSSGYMVNINFNGNTSLETLICNQVYSLSSIDISQNINLKTLELYACTGINTINLTNNGALKTLNVYGTGVSTLDLTSTPLLEDLICGQTAIGSLNLSNNPNLKKLDAYSCTQLTSLDISNCTQLIDLNINDCDISQLNVTNHVNLKRLNCKANYNLTELDLVSNTVLDSLDCSLNFALNCLNVKNGNNTNFVYFNALNTPSLTCIEVDDETYSTANWSNTDASTSFSNYCSNSCSLSIGEIQKDKKEVVKIVNMLGQETVFKPNTVLIYIYSDGTSERVMKLQE